MIFFVLVLLSAHIERLCCVLMLELFFYISLEGNIEKFLHAFGAEAQDLRLQNQI